MKKILVFILTIINVCLISCNKDDDSTSTVDESAIIGTWGLYKITENGEIWAEYEPQPLEGTFLCGKGHYETEYTFLEDRTFDVWWYSGCIGWGGVWKPLGNGKFNFGFSSMDIDENIVTIIDENEIIVVEEENTSDWVEYYIKVDYE